MAAELVSGPRVHGAVLLTQVFVSIFCGKHFQAVGEWVGVPELEPLRGEPKPFGAVSVTPL